MNGHYPMSNNGDIVDLYDTVTSMETDPTTNKMYGYFLKSDDIKY